MNAKDILQPLDVSSLEIVRYPDPRLREACAAIDQVNDDVRDLAAKMFSLMFASNGVGLAAPQVGVPVRLFIASPTFSPADCHVYINPRIVSGEGTANEEEGCLSFPGIFCKVKRNREVTVEAMDLYGKVRQQTCRDLHARILQHEYDHLVGQLLVDRMGTVARLQHRRALQQLENGFAVTK
jgi:peptide deformylase